MNDAFAAAPRLAGELRRDHQVRGDDPPRGLRPAGPQVLRRDAAPGRPDHRLVDDRDLGPGLHHRAAVRDRGRLLQPLHGRPRVRGRLRRVVRPARARALRLRLHDGRQGRHRHRRRARLDADLRRDRRARGHGHLVDDLPVRDAPARQLDGPALRLHRRDRRRLLRLLPGGGPADRRGVLRRLPLDLLDVPEPTGPALQPAQSHVHGDDHRARGLLLRLQRRAADRSAWAPPRRSRWC